jgi:hypothetical protein
VRTAVQAHEEELGHIRFERNGITFTFRGFVDRVEIGMDDRCDASDFVAAVDYKTTRWACPGSGDKKAWDDGVVLQVPLYAYAIAAKRPGTRAVRVEYRALKKPELVHVLELFTCDKNGLKEDLGAKERLDTALDAAVTHVGNARAGIFPVRPAPSCKCPKFCHALEICRVRGGPDTGGW